MTSKRIVRVCQHQLSFLYLVVGNVTRTTLYCLTVTKKSEHSYLLLLTKKRYKFSSRKRCNKQSKRLDTDSNKHVKRPSAVTNLGYNLQSRTIIRCI